jgi:hypothetical protein
MIIKKRKENLNENGTRVSSIISKDATTWAITNNMKMLHLTRIWSNSEESVK